MSTPRKLPALLPASQAETWVPPLALAQLGAAACEPRQQQVYSRSVGGYRMRLATPQVDMRRPVAIDLRLPQIQSGGMALSAGSGTPREEDGGPAAAPAMSRPASNTTGVCATSGFTKASLPLPPCIGTRPFCNTPVCNTLQHASLQHACLQHERAGSTRLPMEALSPGLPCSHHHNASAPHEPGLSGHAAFPLALISRTGALVHRPPTSAQPSTCVCSKPRRDLRGDDRR